MYSLYEIMVLLAANSKLEELLILAIENIASYKW